MIQYKSVLNQLVSELSELDHKSPSLLAKVENGLELATKAKKELDKLLIKKGFANIQDEILFFKSIKPRILGHVIFYSVLLACESKRLSFTSSEYESLVNSKLNFVKAHYDDYSEFLTYFNSESVHLDKLYFVRGSVANPVALSVAFASEYSTGYDVIAAHILAFKDLKAHYEVTEDNSTPELPGSNIEWTATKIALAEVIYAFKVSASVNYGKIDLIELARSLGQFLNMDMEDIHRKFTEIRSRKKNRCLYLTQLIKDLEAKMDMLDE